MKNAVGNVGYDSRALCREVFCEASIAGREFNKWTS